MSTSNWKAKAARHSNTTWDASEKKQICCVFLERRDFAVSTSITPHHPVPVFIVCFNTKHHIWPLFTRAAPCISFLESDVILPAASPKAAHQLLVSRIVQSISEPQAHTGTTVSGQALNKNGLKPCDWWCQQTLWKPNNTNLMIEEASRCSFSLSLCLYVCHSLCTDKHN